MAIVLQVLKYIRDNTLQARLPEILERFNQLPDQHDQILAFLDTVLRYLVQAAKHLSETVLIDALQQALPNQIGATLMSTIAETWLERFIP